VRPNEGTSSFPLNFVKKKKKKKGKGKGKQENPVENCWE
jgi:hypothetical protein